MYSSSSIGKGAALLKERVRGIDKTAVGLMLKGTNQSSCVHILYPPCLLHVITSLHLS